MFKHTENYYIHAIECIESAINKTKKMQYSFMKENYDNWDNFKVKQLVSFNIEIHNLERQLLLKQAEYKLDKSDDIKEIKTLKAVFGQNKCVNTYIKNLETKHHD